METYNKEHFSETSFNMTFVQDNESNEEDHAKAIDIVINGGTLGEVCNVCVHNERVNIHALAPKRFRKLPSKSTLLNV